LTIDPDELSDLIADVRLLLDPQPAMSRPPTVQEIVHAAAVSGWLPPLSDPYLRPVLPPRSY
jgi:hypothetical protein